MTLFLNHTIGGVSSNR